MEQNTEALLRQDVRRLFADKLIADSNHSYRILNSGLIERAGLHFPSNQFALLLLDVIDYLPSENRIGIKAANDVDLELNYAVGGIFEDALSERYECILHQYSGEAFLLLNLRQPLADFAEQTYQEHLCALRETCELCRLRALEQLGIQVHVYISHVVDDAQQLRVIRERLIRDLEADAPARLGKSVITPLDLNTTLRGSDQTMRRESQFLQRRILEYTDKHQFREAADSAIRLIRHDWEHYEMVVSLRERLTSVAHQLFAWLEFPYVESGPHEFLIAEQIRQSLTRDDLEACMLSMFEDFEAHYSPRVARRVEQVDEIIRYIETNYSDPMLNATSISDYFGIHLSYLSRLFRESQGVKLIDYIHSVRVQHAKQILSTNTDTIESVARQVGYLNSLTFTRAFKRCTGVTPGVYRGTV